MNGYIRRIGIKNEINGFIGRSDEKEAIKEFLCQDKFSFLAVSGLNKIGKSWLVNQSWDEFAKENPEKNTLFFLGAINADFSTLTAGENRDKVVSFWKSVLRTIRMDFKGIFIENAEYKDKLENLFKMIKSFPTQKEMEVISGELINIFKTVKNDFGIEFVVYIDEFDYFKGIDDMFFDILIALADAEDITFKMIVCSRVYTENIWSENRKGSFANLFLNKYNIRLNGFREEESKLFYSPLPKSKLKADEKQWV